MNKTRIPFLNQDQFEREYIIARAQNDFPNFYLPHELGFVDRYFQTLVEKQKHHGHHLGEAMDQSSETFHDNAPAEALVSDQDVIVNAVRLLRVNINNARLVDYPKQNIPYVTLGSLCAISFDDDPAEICYVVGDTTGYSTHDSGDNFTPISLKSNVGEAIVGTEPGDELKVTTAMGTMSVAVHKLVQPTWPLKVNLTI